jgi:excisionase family DNA binding protein
MTFDDIARIERAQRRAMSRLERREEDLDQYEYTVPEAAGVLDEHPKTIYRRIRDGEIKAYRRSPRKTRIYHTDLAAYMNKRAGRNS